MSAITTIFVVSDIHLGGEPGPSDTAGFQLCPRPNRERLAQFLNWVTTQQSTGQRTHLVINGDLVDFLAEQKFSPFTSNQLEARAKLKNIIDHSAEVWEALKAAASAGVRMTILLGNHDLEMSLPAPRDLLLESIGPGRVEFLYDNEALAIGPVLIEHGNRYDRWNLVSHDRLREIRSALTRREQPPDMQIPPGSQLVANVLNKIKGRFSFVDLLKPENEGVIPLLAVLDIKSFREAQRVAPLYLEATDAEFDREGKPLDPSYWAGEADVAQKAWRLADDLASGGKGAEYGVADDIGDFIDRIKIAATESIRRKELALLFKALNYFAAAHQDVFDVSRETETYLTPVRAAAQRGFEVVVFGHTHAAKRKRVTSSADSQRSALYLNAGAWTDLIALPPSVIVGDEERGVASLGMFADDLKENRLERWRRQVPTFAQIKLNGDRVESADIHFFDGPGNAPSVPDGPLKRLHETS